MRNWGSWGYWGVWGLEAESAQTARESGKSPNIRKLDKPNLKFSVIRSWIFVVEYCGSCIRSIVMK